MLLKIELNYVSLVAVHVMYKDQLSPSRSVPGVGCVSERAELCTSSVFAASVSITSGAILRCFSHFVLDSDVLEHLTKARLLLRAKSLEVNPCNWKLRLQELVSGGHVQQ